MRYITMTLHSHNNDDIYLPMYGCSIFNIPTGWYKVCKIEFSQLDKQQKLHFGVQELVLLPLFTQD